MKKFFGFFALLCLFPAAFLSAETFTYSYAAGDKYRILSTVNEDVYINQKFDHRSQILNRIAVTVDTAQGQQTAVYETAETADFNGSPVYQWQNEYNSVFSQDGQGYITAINPVLFMPQDRNCPVFPLKNGKPQDFKAGDAWTAPGEEVHDFRANFGISAPYHIPFTANYLYLGMRDYSKPGSTKTVSYPAFNVNYRIYAQPDLSKEQKTGAAKASTLLPVQILGRSSEIIYWNPEKGRPAGYEEAFRIIFTMNNGVTIEYRGTAHAEVTESAVMDKDDLVKTIAKDLGNTPDASVEKTSQGIKITLQNINFDPNSAALRPADQAKLDAIAKILAKYPDRDVLVEGYCAKVGNPATGQALSEARAATVADYLIKNSVRSSEHVVTRGYGDTRPLASNDTEQGRSQNRRVEITLLEN